MAFNLSYFTATLIAVIVSTAFAQVPADCARAYQVAAGDTCDEISAAQNVSTYQLAFVNADVVNPVCTNLFVGEPLCLGITGQDCTEVHQVVAGDSCQAILDAASIDLTTLLANNPNVDSGCANIYPDEVLCIASEVISYTS